MVNEKQIEAGCELDARMAELMGYVRVSNDSSREDDSVVYMVYRGEKVLRGLPWQPSKTDYYEHSFEAWSPSTDISAAWEVVEHLRAHYRLRVAINQTADRYQVAIGKPAPYQNLVTVFEVHAPFAICRAALAATEDK